ncbi:MAG: tRNA (cytidine(34)-2'-O)-methyltransferase [Hyphomicrobiales bacterium]
MIEIALYQPDIPPNTGTILRMGACFGLTVHIIEPAGFQWADSAFRRAGLDYLDRTRLIRHRSWATFRCETDSRRLILLTTKASLPYTAFAFCPRDIILMGRETSGVPADVHAEASARLVIPMAPGNRSLNVALACAIVTGEALRQLDGYRKLNLSAGQVE